MHIVTQTSNLILETRTYETVTSIKIQGRLGICKSQAREFGSNLVSVRSQARSCKRSRSRVVLLLRNRSRVKTYSHLHSILSQLQLLSVGSP